MRELRALCFFITVVLVLTSCSLFSGKHEPAVFMYHLIMEEPYSEDTGLFVTPSEFEAQLDAIVESKAATLFADEYAVSKKPSVIITFDDGYEDNYTTAYPLLKERGLKATIFLVVDLIGTEGYMTEEQIFEMSESGLVKFGSHTKSHKDLSTLDEDQVRYELEESKKALEELLGYEVKSFAYPVGGYNDSVVKIASEIFGFAYTTKNPDDVEADNMLLIPRYAVFRGYGGEYVASRIPK